MAMSQSKGGPPSLPPNSDCAIASAKLLRQFLASVPTWVSLKAQSWNVLPADLAFLIWHAAKAAAPTVVNRNSRLVDISSPLVRVVRSFSESDTRPNKVGRDGHASLKGLRLI